MGMVVALLVAVGQIIKQSMILVITTDTSPEHLGQLEILGIVDSGHRRCPRAARLGPRRQPWPRCRWQIIT